MKSRISGYGTPQARVVTSRKMGAKDKTMQQSISSTATLSRGRAFNFEGSDESHHPKTICNLNLIQGKRSCEGHTGKLGVRFMSISGFYLLVY